MPRKPFITGRAVELGDDNEIGVQSTAAEGLEASIRLSYQDTPVGAIRRMLSLQEMDDEPSPIMQPGDLNKKYPWLEKPFTQPTSQAVADEIASRQRDRQKLQQIIESGPDSAFYGIGTFGASMIPHAIDPINVAASFATAGVFSVASGAARAGMTLGKASIARNIGEGLVGNALVEPLTYMANDAEQVEYGLTDSFTNVVAGAVAFPLIAATGGRAMRFLRGIRKGKMADATYRSSVAQTAMDKKVDTNPILEFQIKEIDVKGDYEHVPLDTHKGKTFYAATEDVTDDVTKASPIGEPLGDGVYATLNGEVANAYANRGNVHALDLSEANIYYMDAPIQGDAKKVFDDALGMDTDGLSGKEAIELLLDSGEDAVVKRLQEGLREMGYDGLVYTQDNIAGRKINPHHTALIFNPEKAKKVSSTRADSSRIPQPSKEDARMVREGMEDPKRDTYHSRDLDMDTFMQNLEKPLDPPPKPSDLIKEVDSQIEELQALKEQELLDDFELRDFDELLKERKRLDKVSDALRKAQVCIKGA